MAREYTVSRNPAHPGSADASLRIDYAAELNEKQFAAVTAPPGPALVIAGAGSGKTRTLTYRVAYLLDNGVRPANILLLTFTNKAAREMLERVGELVPHDLRDLWGGTFHSVGNRILRRHAREIGWEP
ncbi:MAG: UvrD-helicase domain-containing protein, partial [Verrucomicrobia bacterium]|nr:UvrD-helicase domain-containing protein [Verrucomicrobiota bacterium]